MEDDIKTIGIIDPDRLKYIPERYWAQHEFCFHLHDLMAHVLLQMQRQNIGQVTFDITAAEDRAVFEDGINILEFLEQSGRGDLEQRVVITHVCNALYADMLHFIYEGLRALEKRKFAVAFSLLRKPLKEGILIASQMCGDEPAFFQKLKHDAKKLKDVGDKKEVLASAIEACRASKLLDADAIYDSTQNHGNENGLAGLFDKAAHYSTSFRHIATENYNINFIFKDAEDDDVYQSSVYPQVAKHLLFLHLMQIELYGRMREPNQKYRNLLTFTAVGTYEALFTDGRSRIVQFVNKHFREFLTCPSCQADLRIKKKDAARLYIGETVDCERCLASHHFPFGWLLSKVDLDLTEGR